MIDKTVKLFEQDSYQKTFKAKVLDCKKEKEYYQVVLDQTCFFPEGGGQPYDLGFLDNKKVWKVFEREGFIYHYLKEAIELDKVVLGEIDWGRRFVLTQNHSAEHMVSGIVHQIYGYDNIGFHMGNQEITMDFNGELGEEDLIRIEQLANEAVVSNQEVIITYPSNEELKSMEYRSKKEIDGELRIVTFPGIDQCACCGTHVRYTGEIGMIKLLSRQRNKGGTRVSMIAGAYAWRDYQQKHKNIVELSQILSAKPELIVDSVNRILKENEILKWKKQARLLELLQFKLNNIPDGCERYFSKEKDLDARELRDMCISLCKKAELVLLLVKDKKDQYRYIIGSQSLDVRIISKDLNDKFAGRGGGTMEAVQGILTGKKKEIEQYFYSIEYIKERRNTNGK